MIFAGTLSYASFILTAFFTMEGGNSFENQNYLFQFAGYRLLLLFMIGLIGFFASNTQRSYRIIALVVSVLWMLVSISGIT
ncbi:putative membrane protein [Methanofollis sp. W23]|uniref:hypothetical protein n=1 Tax=Methanofollis sp. W23 TaxID=2817849 RepID=UPI001AEB1489|nr:hypothetical protein [Methanofollis sp. W23]MBP2146608.1 putative membrane protein [Methanofollis sp. W23]